MTTMNTPSIYAKTVFTASRVIRLVTAILVIANLAACATAPAGKKPMSQGKAGIDISTAVDSYNSRDFSNAIKGFDSVIANDSSSANSVRLAHLGKSMVYLGNDKRWQSIDNAKLSMLAASQVKLKKGETFAGETGMLMDAVSEVIGTESKYSMVREKTSGSGQEISELRRELEAVKTERDALEMERDELIAEQELLNDALEKLKKISLGN